MIAKDGFGWETLSYIVLLLLLWIIIRYFADNLPDILQLLYVTENVRVDVWTNNVYYPVSYWTEKGSRPYQEDRHFEGKGVGEIDSSIYGVFDGHAGARAAQFCKDHLLAYLLADEDFVERPALALKKTFFK